MIKDEDLMILSMYTALYTSEPTFKNRRLLKKVTYDFWDMVVVPSMTDELRMKLAAADVWDKKSMYRLVLDVAKHTRKEANAQR